MTSANSSHTRIRSVAAIFAIAGSTAHLSLLGVRVFIATITLLRIREQSSSDDVDADGFFRSKVNGGGSLLTMESYRATTAEEESELRDDYGNDVLGGTSSQLSGVNTLSSRPHSNAACAKRGHLSLRIYRK